MITQPQADITIPNELQKKLDGVRNTITVNEAEVLRLRELVISLEYSVTELHKEKTYLSQLLEEMQGQINIAKTNRDAIENEFETIKHNQEVLKARIAHDEQNATQKTKELIAREEEVMMREKNVEALEKELDKRLTAFEKAEDEIEIKKSKLSKVLMEL